VLPFLPDENLRVLDVGGGYGAFTEEILDEWPRAVVVLHDFSAAMMDEARIRLAAFSDRVTFHSGDLREPGWSAGLAGPFHAVVSSIAIHNVRHPAIVRRVYGDIARLVGPGGCFVNVDLVAVPGPLAARAYGHRREAWRGAGERATMVVQMRWLQESGFDEVDCLWKEGAEACLAAYRKPEGATSDASETWSRPVGG
jgi:tRNA (cmo5U34)-methyltransferase